MRKLMLVAAAFAALGLSAPAWAVVGTTTVKVEDGATSVPEATVTVTFKNQAGTPIRTVTRTTRRTGTPRINIPDNSATADISVTTRNGRTEQRVGIDIGQLTNKDFTINVPGGSSPRTPSGPSQAMPPIGSGPEGTIVGVGLGGQTTACNNWRTTRIQSADIDDPIGEGRDACFSSAFRGSFYVGTSWRVGASWLAGIEADIGITKSSKAINGIPGSIGGIPGVTAAVAANDGVTVKKDWDASVRGRFGYFVTPKSVLYGTFGVAFQDIEATVNCTTAGACGTNGFAAFTATNSKTLVGWTLGGGLEIALSDRVVARGEYRYADYGKFTALYGTPATIGITSDIDLRTHTALLGLALKMGGT
jgi:outer membrane immunogenic protein